MPFVISNLNMQLFDSVQIFEEKTRLIIYLGLLQLAFKVYILFIYFYIHKIYILVIMLHSNFIILLILILLIFLYIFL